MQQFHYRKWRNWWRNRRSSTGNASSKSLDSFRGIKRHCICISLFLQATSSWKFKYSNDTMTMILFDIMEILFLQLKLNLSYACRNQDTLKSPPAENKTMKKASVIPIIFTTFFYLGCGCFGYAAFGNDTPGNLISGFGFCEPYWIVDFANVRVIIHLVGGIK